MAAVDLAVAAWLKSDALTLSVPGPAAARWPTQGVTIDGQSPFATLAGATAEAARRGALQGHPLVRDRAVVAGERRDLIGRCITLSNAALGYAGGAAVVVIGVAEQDNGTSVLTVLRRLGAAA